MHTDMNDSWRTTSLYQSSGFQTTPAQASTQTPPIIVRDKTAKLINPIIPKRKSIEQLMGFVGLFIIENSRHGYIGLVIDDSLLLLGNGHDPGGSFRCFDAFQDSIHGKQPILQDSPDYSHTPQQRLGSKLYTTAPYRMIK